VQCTQRTGEHLSVSVVDQLGCSFSRLYNTLDMVMVMVIVMVTVKVVVVVVMVMVLGVRSAVNTDVRILI